MTLTPGRRLVGSLFRIALFAPLLLWCDDEQVRATRIATNIAMAIANSMYLRSFISVSTPMVIKAATPVP
jgi:hypothetical protein